MTSSLITRRALCTVIATAPLSGCVTQRSEARSTAFDQRREYRGPLVDPATIPGDFMWQQRVTALHGEKKGGFDAVVQKKGAELLVLGLTPMKTRGFSLTQKGTDFEYKQFVPFELPFNPQAVLFDIHRAFFYELLAPFPDSGERISQFEQERIVDEFYKGRLVRRVFENVAGSEEKLTVDYAPLGYKPGVPPESTNLENFAYDYRLRVVTNSTQAL